MINEHSFAAIEQALFSNGLLFPLYETYCFSRIPATVRYLLTGKGKDKALPLDTIGQKENSSDAQVDVVALIVLDGFGWRFFNHYQKQYPLLRRWNTQGICSKLTAQFPSTTAAQITCMHTGLEVGRSGVYEWFYYEPLVDDIIAPLLTSFARDKKMGTLRDVGLDTKLLYPHETVYEELIKDGISSYLLQPSNIAGSCYSQSVCKGCHMEPYHQFAEGVDHFVDLIRKTPPKEKRYLMIYFGDIDGAGHHHGLFSPQYEEAVAKTIATLEKHLYSQLNDIDKKVALIITADHGMIDINPKTTLYINEAIPHILPFIKKNKVGKPIAPAGSCRDFFLHIEEDKLDEVQKYLNNQLEGKAWVVTTKELIERGFFGTKTPSKAFLDRVGNLVLLPWKNGSIWWHEAHHFEQKFLGAHGGLSVEEMETIFLFERFGKE